MIGVQKNSVFSLLLKHQQNDQEEEKDKIFDKLPVTTNIQTNHLKRKRLQLMKDMSDMTIKKVKCENL